MVSPAFNKLAVAREEWRSRMEDLSQEDRVKVATLLTLSLPVDGMVKHALVKEFLRPVGRAAGWLGERIFGPAARSVAPVVERAAPRAAAGAVGGAERSVASTLGKDMAYEYAPAGAAAGAAPAAAAGAAGGAAEGAASSQLPGYLGRIQKAWTEMGEPGPWMNRYLGRLAGPAAKAMKYTMFPIGPGLAAYSGLTGQQGPVTTLSSLVGPLATLPLGPKWWIPEMAFGIWGAPKVDQWMGWKPKEQRDAEMYSAGARQGMMGVMPPATVQQGQAPAPGAFYEPTLAYTPMGQMQTEQAGRVLRGEY